MNIEQIKAEENERIRKARVRFSQRVRSDYVDNTDEEDMPPPLLKLLLEAWDAGVADRDAVTHYMAEWKAEGYPKGIPFMVASDESFTEEGKV